MKDDFLGLGLFSNNRRKKLEDMLDKEKEKNPATEAPNPKVDFENKLASEKLEDLFKVASSKLELIDEAFKDDEIAKEVAYMIATSHEYKKPNEKAAIKLVSNYKWSRGTERVDNLQGINKPVCKSKVLDIAIGIKGKTPKPLMVVDKFQGITPQSKGKRILLDGHHRKEALEFLGVKETPVFLGKYTGKAEKDLKELVSKDN